MQIAVSGAKGKITIGELASLPNRFIHTLYYNAIYKDMQAEKNPKGPEAQEIQAEAMSDQLMGNT